RVTFNVVINRGGIALGVANGLNLVKIRLIRERGRRSDGIGRTEQVSLRIIGHRAQGAVGSDDARGVAVCVALGRGYPAQRVTLTYNLSQGVECKLRGVALPSVSEAVAFWLLTIGAGFVGLPRPIAVFGRPWSLLAIRERVSPSGRTDWANLPA